jgi:hypothetical protein
MLRPVGVPPDPVKVLPVIEMLRAELVTVTHVPVQ